MVNIGIYDQNKNLIGYKADTFWTLTKIKDHAKSHSLFLGEIPANIIDNLQIILKGKDTAIDTAIDDKRSVLDALINVAYQNIGDSNNLLVGYEQEDYSEVTITHKITNGILSPL